MSAGRKSPVLMLKWKRPVDARQAIWDVLRALDADANGVRFTARAVSDGAKIHLDTVSSYFECLVAGGVLGKADNLFHLIKPPSLHAPRLRADGTPVEQGRGRSGAWRTMRVFKRFTVLEIHNASGASQVDIKSFCKYLLKAGYLRAIVKGAGGKPSTYQLIKDTGPRPPQVTRIKCVFDPNLGAITWPAASVEAETTVEGAV
jgi:hypothetical protein